MIFQLQQQLAEASHSKHSSTSAGGGEEVAAELKLQVVCCHVLTMVPNVFS
jgi:hypothetical protein